MIPGENIELALAVLAQEAEQAGEIELPLILDEAAALVNQGRTAGLGDKSFNESYNRVMESVMAAINPQAEQEGLDPGDPDSPDEIAELAKDAYGMTMAKLKLVQAACERKYGAVKKRLEAMKAARKEMSEQSAPAPDDTMPMRGPSPAAQGRAVYKNPEDLAGDIAYLRAVGDALVF
jgi:hypothetical protein